MGYHIEASRSGFKELPDRILVREDGWLGAYKFDGEPIVDYWYVPEQRVDELRQELAIREASEQEKVIDYLGKECVDWEDKYRALAKENAKLRELVSGLEHCSQGFACNCCPLHDSSDTNHRRCESLEQELGIEAPDA